jgi:hypothetical protein
MLTQEERLLTATKTIEALVRARKAAHLYPERNRIVENVVSEFYQEIQQLLAYQDKIVFEIKPDSILFEMEEILSSLPGETGLVSALYCDGIRKILFRTGLIRDEAFRFVVALAGDSGRAAVGDDLVTAIWEQDFRYISCSVYEPEIFDRPDIMKTLKQESSDYSDLSAELKRIYSEAADMADETYQIPDTIELSDEELMALRSDTDTNQYDRTGKALAICLELFLLPGDKKYDKLEAIMKRAVEYALDKRKLDVLMDFFIQVRSAYMVSSADSDFRRSLLNIFSFFSSERFLTRLGSMLDEGIRLERDTFNKLSILLADNSVPVLVKLLGYLDTISARKTIVNLLVMIGSRNMPALYEALHDEKWYVVRNIVITLRQIGDKKAREYLLDMLNHKDNRVRRESIKAVAELGGNEAADFIRRALEDTDESVRHFALGSMGKLEDEIAKQMLIGKVTEKRFRGLAYPEKREYYSALLRYDGDEVVQLLSGMLRKKSFFRKAANDENRAAIAHCIGAYGYRVFLPVLQSIDQTGSELLRNNVDEAIRKMGNEN